MFKTQVIVFGALFGSASLSVQAGVEQSFDVPSFTRIAASQGVEVNISMGLPAQVVASAETDQDLQRLEIEVDDGELRVRRGSWSSSIWNWGTSNGKVLVKVVVPKLEGLASSSGANVTAIDIDCDELSLDASSGSRLAVSGHCNDIDVDASSGARIESGEFMSRSVSVNASSGASIDIFASATFQGDASRGASVNVYGAPRVFEADTSSGARITREEPRELI